jgi:hypothetical protein
MKCCWVRECRKETKELLVQADKNLSLGSEQQADVINQVKIMAPLFPQIDASRFGVNEGKEIGAKTVTTFSEAALVERGVLAGTGKAFIGGGCCVHLSIEYTPTNPTSTLPAIVVVMVQDSENTLLAWAKLATPSEGYQIKEGIVTTKPGARLTMLVLNARMR